MPFAFTEQGVSMLSSVLRSDAAIQVNIAVMRAFVAMRNYITTTTTLTAELSEIRAKLALLERTDEDNAEAINDLSEDMRKELDNIYQAIAALSVKTPQARKQPRLLQQRSRQSAKPPNRHPPRINHPKRLRPPNLPVRRKALSPQTRIPSCLKQNYQIHRRF